MNGIGVHTSSHIIQPVHQALTLALDGFSGNV